METIGKIATLGSAIKLARKEAGLTQKQLGEVLGTTQENISLLEKSGNTTTDTLKRIATALNIEWRISENGFSFTENKPDVITAG